MTSKQMRELLDKVDLVVHAWDNWEKRKTGPTRMELKAAIENLRATAHQEGV